MDLSKPRINRLVAPKMRTYEAVGDYLTSKKLTKKFPKETEGNDVIVGNVAVNLSMAKRDLHHAELRLKAKKHYEREQLKELDRRWAELEKKEHEFRESFIQFNDFIKENEQKNIRALDQREYYREMIWERTKKNNELLFEFWELKKTKQLMEEKLEEYAIYENFLNKVVKAYPGQFKSVMEVIQRYETLIDAKQVLASRQQSDIDMLHLEKDKFRHVINDFLQNMDTMHNKLAVLMQRYENARASCLMWERVLEGVKNGVAEKMLEVHEVRTTCKNLYEMICQEMGVKPEFRDNVEMQLFCIRKTLRDLDRVNRAVRKTQQKDLLASERTLLSGSSR